MLQNYYEILGINRDATQTEIKQAVQNELNEVKAAFTILSDQEKRQTYDELIKKMNSPQMISTVQQPNRLFSLLKIFATVIILAMIAGGYWFVTEYSVSLSNASVNNEISVPSPKINPSKSANSVPIEVAVVAKSTENEKPVTKKTEPTAAQPVVVETAEVSNITTTEAVVEPVEQNPPVVVANKPPIEEPIAPAKIPETPSIEEHPIEKNEVIVAPIAEIVKKEVVVAKQELPAKILYKDFFQQNKTIAITIALTNNLAKSIQSFDGMATFYDQDGTKIGALLLSEYDILKKIVDKNKYAIQKDKAKKWGLNINFSQNAAIYTQLLNKRLTNLKIQFFITEVTYVDGEKVTFN